MVACNCKMGLQPNEGLQELPNDTNTVTPVTFVTPVYIKGKIGRGCIGVIGRKGYRGYSGYTLPPWAAPEHANPPIPSPKKSNKLLVRGSRAPTP